MSLNWLTRMLVGRAKSHELARYLPLPSAMKRTCPHCSFTHDRHPKFGSFFRKSDGRRLKRFRCKQCRLTFSEATRQKCYRQKKRRLNPRIFELLCSGVSQRRVAKLLKISRTTVVRKFLFLAHWSRIKNQKKFDKLEPLTEIQFDDLETIEHTKCKPLSVTMIVNRADRQIIEFCVSRMPAKGLIAEIARKKYGRRPDERGPAREELFSKVSSKISPNAIIHSDENPHYPPSISKWFPQATHKAHKGKRGCVAGQGELKKIGFDPLFTLNHTYAMLRANINRLIRKTWCTTKDPKRLKDHIDLYVDFHNHQII
jgi:transposase-like protein